MKTLVQILAQYSENYNYYEGGTPNWRKKGSQQFFMYVDSDVFLYEEEICVAAIQSLLAEQSNKLCKFEYVSHELVFAEPIELKGFDERVETMLKLKYASKVSN